VTSDLRLVRWTAVGVGVALGVLIPALLSDFLRTLAADAAIAGLIVLSLVVLTGLVGQISFCQYSFAAIGAFTVGSLVAGHHWDFWLALVVGVVFAAVVGVLVGFVALRLSGLFLAILTIGVALFFDRFVLAAGNWNSFSGGLSSWRPGRPSFFGIGLHGEYAFYLFAFGVLLAACLLVWNLRTGKTGRVLRAVRESEVAASTVGLNLTAWKLTAFGISAALAGLAGALAAVRVGSVSPGSYDFLHSISIAAIAIVAGAGSIASAAAGGIFLIFGREALIDWTSLSTQWFDLIIGAGLIFQLVYAPDGAVVDIERRVMRRLRPPKHLPREAEQRAPDKVPAAVG